MNEKNAYQLIASSARQTQAMGQLIGQALEIGTTIKLLGDLGAGKTCFVQGLAKGLSVPDTLAVTSPTYTLINEYPGRLSLFHVDLYRIQSSEDAEAIGLFDIFTPNHVVAIEWADRLTDMNYPPEHLTIDLKMIENDSRHINIIGCGLKMINLIKKIGLLWDTRQDKASR